MSNSKRLAQIDALFRAVLEASSDEAEQLLEERADDPDLVREVRSLLQYDRQADTIMVSFEADRLARARLQSPHKGSTAGEKVGAYRLIEQIARGGMGVVWLGERADGAFEQRVALKVLPAGSLSASAIRRFELERQILARLNHDNIARLLDGGVDERGRPFLAMELVEGEPIGVHCDRGRLPVGARLRLVIATARAVQAAHSSLIVHCDLKPANILVTDQGVVKLLDFGIAELLGADEEELSKGVERRRLTPEYASPESLSGEPITAAADIHQLGLLTYELVCGHRARKGGSSSMEELAREVMENVPSIPSSTLTESGNESRAEEIAVSRGTTVHRLRRTLAGDLDSIVLKALAHDPSHRYRSAEEFAADLERFLEGYPVGARDLGWAYRTRKLIRRHPAISALAAVLFFFAIGLVLQTRIAREQRDRAELEAEAARSWAARSREVSDFLVSMLTDASLADLKEDLTVVELLDKGARRAQEEFSEDSGARAELEEIMGRVYFSLGQTEKALSPLGAAVERRRKSGEDASELAESILHLARAHNHLGHHQQTKDLLYDALRLQRADSGPGPPTMEIAESLTLLSYVHGMLGELEPMLALRHESLAIRKALFGTDHVEVAQGLNDLCFAYKDIGEYGKARDLCLGALDIRQRHGNAGSVASSLGNLALVELGLGLLDDAERHLREALAWSLKNFPNGHPRTGIYYVNLGQILLESGQLEAAGAAYKKGREVFVQVFPSDHRSFAWLDILETQVEVRRGLPEKAEQRVRLALALLRRAHGEDQHTVLQGRIALAESLIAQQQEHLAILELRDTVRRLRKGRSADERWLRRARELLALLGVEDSQAGPAT